jgi:hypothetical protein
MVAVFRSRAGSATGVDWAPARVCIPHLAQKRASAARTAPQVEQVAAEGVPQAGQKRASGSSARPQVWQFTAAS